MPGSSRPPARSETCACARGHATAELPWACASSPGLAGAERFAGADDAALAELGRRLGVICCTTASSTPRCGAPWTISGARNDELRASRVRLVATADAERRRIERDLHDGAQQHLVALAVNLRLADDAIADDPSAAPELLGALGADVRGAIDELRVLAHGIYPPLLVDAGLGRGAAASPPTGSPSPVAVDQPGRRPLSHPRSRPRCTSAASRPCRTPPSTPRERR